MPQGFSIAIDGPVASGKGTTAKALAQEFDGIFIDTGAMYRTVALYCLEKNIDPKNQVAVERILQDISVEFKNGKVYLNSEDVSGKIRKPKISESTSIVASYPKVRQELVLKQKAIASDAINNDDVVVMEGRDIGTVILPDAELKIFLNAGLEVRAKRRFEQYQEEGMTNDYDLILRETKERDERDMNREKDPLPKNPEELGYFVIDNSEQTESDTIKIIKAELRKRGLIND